MAKVSVVRAKLPKRSGKWVLGWVATTIQGNHNRLQLQPPFRGGQLNLMLQIGNSATDRAREARITEDLNHSRGTSPRASLAYRGKHVHDGDRPTADSESAEVGAEVARRSKRRVNHDQQ